MSLDIDMGQEKVFAKFHRNWFRMRSGIDAHSVAVAKCYESCLKLLDGSQENSPCR